MVHSDGEVAASGPAGPDAVTAAQRWLSERGLPAPDPVPASPGQTSDSGRSRSRRGAGAEAAAARGFGTGPGDVDPEEKARGVVLRKLTGQARTRHELDQALKSKEIPETVANGVLDRMEELGLVDDAAFARDWVESRQQRRYLSRRALRHELQAKGVDADQIAEALTSVDGEDEYVAARALAERKAQGLTGLPREVRYRRLAGVLGRRGFSGGVVGRVISEVLAEDPS